MIEVSHISKHFKVPLPGKGLGGQVKALFSPEHKTIRAVDDISYTIQPGEIVGYLGPNGAGKSTTIKLLTGVLTPTSGSVKVHGIVPYKDRTANAYRIGVVYGQRSQLWWDLPLIDSFEILAAMYRVPPKHFKERLDFFVDLLQMRDFLNQPVRRLSLGQRMKGDIVSALLHEPPVLYLDEPTIGLDVIAKNRILEFIRQLNSEKKTTVILTTHDLSDVEQICQRIMIIDRGKVVLDDSQREILNRFGRRKQLVVEFQGDAPMVELPGGCTAKAEENKLIIEFERDQISAFDLILSLRDQPGVLDISIKEDNIESIVTRIYEQGAR